MFSSSRTISKCIVSLTVLFIAIASSSHANDLTLKSIKSLRYEGITMQTKDYSCGAASLAILFEGYFGDPHPEHVILADILSRLTKKEYIKRLTEGFSMLDLKESAERFGYQAEGVIPPREALCALEGPVIILLKRKESNHFVVLKGADGERAFIADPIRGHLGVPLRELYKEWGGEALVIGREDFGLPIHYGLAINSKKNTAPEKDVARALQRTLPP